MSVRVGQLGDICEIDAAKPHAACDRHTSQLSIIGQHDRHDGGSVSDDGRPVARVEQAIATSSAATFSLLTVDSVLRSSAPCCTDHLAGLTSRRPAFRVLRPKRRARSALSLHIGCERRQFRRLARAVDAEQLSQAVTSDLDELEIPLPPLDEQRRIAAILDKADALRRKRKRALDLLDSLTQSIFLEMFGDPVSNPKDCQVATWRCRR